MPGSLDIPSLTPGGQASSVVAKPSGFGGTQASVLLDMVRGLAAISVILGHWRNLFFVDFGDLAGPHALFALPYLMTGAGHQAVIIFFVLSGYLISGSVFRMFRKGAWSWRTYLLHRIVRLWIVLVPGLLFAALLDAIGFHLQRAPAVALYAGLSGNHLIQDVHVHTGLLIWLGNLFFLQPTFVPVFGSDYPLWSLANEFWYYMLFPLGLLAYRRQTPVALRVLFAVLFAVICVFIEPAILYLFPAWLLGTLLALLPPPRLSLRWRVAASVIYVPVVFFFSKIKTTHTVAVDLLFSVITFGFLYALLSAGEPAHEDRRSTHMWRILAKFSYTLYVVHLPLLVLVAALILPAVRWQPDVPHFAAATGIFVLAIAVAYLFAWCTEFRTDVVRKFLERRLPG